VSRYARSGIGSPGFLVGPRSGPSLNPTTPVPRATSRPPLPPAAGYVNPSRGKPPAAAARFAARGRAIAGPGTDAVAGFVATVPVTMEIARFCVEVRAWPVAIAECGASAIGWAAHVAGAVAPALLPAAAADTDDGAGSGGAARQHPAFPPSGAVRLEANIARQVALWALRSSLERFTTEGLFADPLHDGYLGRRDTGRVPAALAAAALHPAVFVPVRVQVALVTAASRIARDPSAAAVSIVDNAPSHGWRMLRSLGIAPLAEAAPTAVDAFLDLRHAHTGGILAAAASGFVSTLFPTTGRWDPVAAGGALIDVGNGVQIRLGGQGAMRFTTAPGRPAGV
jgi:hypothetical protein